MFAIKINPIDLALSPGSGIGQLGGDKKKEYVETYLAHICISTVTLPSIICHMKADTMRPPEGGRKGGGGFCQPLKLKGLPTNSFCQFDFQWVK